MLFYQVVREFVERKNSKGEPWTAIVGTACNSATEALGEADRWNRLHSKYAAVFKYKVKRGTTDKPGEIRYDEYRFRYTLKEEDKC